MSQAPVRVLLVSNMFPSAGRPHSGIFVAREARALTRAGVELEVEPIAMDRGEADYFRSRSRIRTRVRRFHPDLIHAHYGYSQVAAAFQRVPFVVTLYGDDLNGESDGAGGITAKSRLGVMATRSLARFARLVIVQSEAMLERLPSVLREKAVVLGSGVDDEHFSPQSRDDARRRFGLDDSDLVLGFVNSGRQPTKRLDLAEATRDELARRGHSARLLVAEQVPAEEIRWHYAASDVLLMTSDLEGSPNCVKEALACGTPVVSVPVGDVPQVVRRSEQGAIVGRSVAELADGVERVVAAAPGTRVSLLPEHLRASFVAERLIELYLAVLRGR